MIFPRRFIVLIAITILFVSFNVAYSQGFANETEWVKQFGTPTEDSIIAVSAYQSDTYVVGKTLGALPDQTNAGFSDAFIRKYDDQGNTLLTKQFGGIYDDSATGIFVHDTGIYITGVTCLSSTQDCYIFVKKYNTLGNEVWHRQIGTVGSFARASKITVNSSGIYVVNQSDGVSITIRKFDLLGNELWVKLFESSVRCSSLAFTSILPEGIALGIDGVYVAGSTDYALSNGSCIGNGFNASDGFIIKYDFDGNRIWTRQLGTTDTDTVKGIVVGPDGVYVGGSTEGSFLGQTSLGSFDFFIRKYDGNGNQIWTRQFGTPLFDFPAGISLDDTSVYFAGAFDTLPDLSDDIFVRAYSLDGTEIWTNKFGTAGSDFPSSIAVHAHNVYVAGGTDGTFLGEESMGARDAFVAKLGTALYQFKSDGQTKLSEGDSTAESTAVFKGKIISTNSVQVKLQIEIKTSNTPFDGTGVIESTFVLSGNEASITKEGLVDGQYHFRTRVMDSAWAVSEWQEFGVVGNTDFTVRTVPLYTQVASNFPVRLPDDEWAGELYAGGRGNHGPLKDRCGLYIRNCGCAITSMVMLGRYYGVNMGIDGTDVNPLKIDKWLLGNNGYNEYGKVFWKKAVDYLGFIDPITNKKLVRFSFNDKKDWNVASTSSRIASYLNSAQPVVAYNNKANHYLILDNKLSNTYTVKDPAWYNTKTLLDTQNLSNNIRGYGNYFTTANIFTYLETPRFVTNSIHIALASPAELLITDPQGRRLGKDPISNISYDEIPDAIYMRDGPIVTSDIDLDPGQIHETKEISIETPIDGNYQLQVIGTGTGTYTLDSLSYDYNGDSHSQTITGTTTPSFVDEYNLNIAPVGQPVNLDLNLTSQGIDECPTLNGTNLGCPAKIDFLSLEKISNSAGIPELISPIGETRYTAPIVSGERGTTEVKAKLYDETKLLAFLGTRSIPSEQLCAIFDDTGKDSALISHLAKTTDTQGRFSFGVPTSTNVLTLIESVRETIAGQSKRVCLIETISPRDFVAGVATKEVSQVTLTVRNTNSGILVKKTAGHNSQTIDY